MSTLFVRPGHTHTASRVLSATSEAGLTVAPPTPGANNVGRLRLRATGNPVAAAALDVKLQTGGNASGYALVTGSGQGLGAAAIWKRTTDTAAPGTLEWRGYVDTPYLVRVDYPVAYGTGVGRPSTPRTLANGDLGFVTSHAPTTSSTFTFTRVTTAGVASTVTIDATSTTSDKQSDFAVLPNGRLVVIRAVSLSLTRFSSDDDGVTWSASSSCGTVLSAQDMVSLEYVDDLLVMVVASSTGGAVTEVRVSQDEGYNWTTVDSSQTLRNVRTCVTASGKILAISLVGSAPEVRTIAPGGGLSTTGVDSELTCNSGRLAIVTRDDGVIWAFATNSTAGSHVDIDASCSLDGGETWTNPLAGQKVVNLNSTNTNAGWRAISAGTWAGRVVILALSRSSGGGASDYAMHLYTLGGWETVTEGGNVGSVIEAYNAGYIPVDYPDALATPWSRVNTGAGATVTNQGPLRFVSTGANATYYLAPTAVLAASDPGGTYKVRYRCRQVSGGSVAVTSNGFRFSVSDGSGNHQGFILRMSTTQFQIVDTSGTNISLITADMTIATEFLFAFAHDYVAGVSGRLAFWYRQDGEATWTDGPVSAVAEYAVVGNSQLRIGGSSAVAGTHDCYFIGVSGSSDNLEAGYTNPDNLRGRALGTLADYYLSDGIYLGGRNMGGVPGDTYTVATTYQFGKESIWHELRPSRKCHSASDNASWNVVFDAGATDTFRGDTAGLFGTNFRTATLQFNSSDSWGTPALALSLDATLDTRTIGAGNRGPGYVGPTSSPSWRPGQFRSDGDGHRFFLDVGGTVYEITDNDADRIYVTGADFSAASGSMYVFGDHMAIKSSFVLYRFMRLLVGAQQTPAADNCYHVGTLIFDRSFTPAQTYDHGFVDRIEPRVEVMEADSGYRTSARIGPRRRTLAIQWAPIAYASASFDLELRLRDFYASLEGAHRPIMFWRDTNDVGSAGLYRVAGVYQATNVWGEGTSALTRVDQLVLEECL